MTEDELLTGITDALTLGGWRWWHIRRSDRALLMGHRGWPDVTAVKAGRLLLLEAKTARGLVENDQWEWLGRLRSAGIDARVVRPADYDALVAELTGDRLLAVAGRRT